MKRYFGFFPNRHLWVANPATDIDDLSTIKDKSVDEKRKALMQIMLEINEENYEFALSRDGMLLLRIPELEERINADNEAIRNDMTASMANTRQAWDIYLKLANVVFLFLDSSLHGHGRNNYLIEMRELTKLSAYRMTVDDGKVKSGTDYEIESLATLLRLGHVDEEKYDDYFFRNRFELDVSVLEDLNEYYLKPLFADSLNQDYLELLAKSLSEFNLKNNSVSLILSWALIEGHVNRLWDSSANAAKMSGKPQSIFWLIEMLKSWGELEESETERIHTFRNARNKFIHKSKKVAVNQARDCLEYIKERAITLVGLELFFNTSGTGTHGM